MFKHYLSYILATGFGSGYAPLAPGTAGSLLALLIYIYLPLPPWWWLIIIILTSITGVKTGTYVEKRATKDPAIVVIDEMAGQWLSLLFLPRTIPVFVAAFLIFRVLDIVKPFPANSSQKLKGGLGIMLDDLIAGIYTNILIWGGWWVYRII
jgi:phosphatidylglycerophosphatase A